MGWKGGRVDVNRERLLMQNATFYTETDSNLTVSAAEQTRKLNNLHSPVLCSFPLVFITPYNMSHSQVGSRDSLVLINVPNIHRN